MFDHLARIVFRATNEAGLSAPQYRQTESAEPRRLNHASVVT
jgi:hypothetical protein